MGHLAKEAPFPKQTNPGMCDLEFRVWRKVYEGLYRV